MSGGGALKIIQLGNPPVALSASDLEIGVSSSLSPAEVINVVCESGFKHVVQSDGLAFDAELQAAKTMIEKPELFLSDPILAIMGAGPVDSSARLNEVFAVGQKKKDVLAVFEAFLAQVKGAGSIKDSALMVMDELFTNGAKNAWPKDRSLFAGPPVRAGHIEIFAQADGERLVMGCRDSFGEYDSGLVTARIKTCFEKGVANAIRHGTTGAGIGSFMIFDACISYYAGAEKGRRTVVCAAFPLSRGNRVRGTLSKNIHLLP